MCPKPPFPEFPTLFVCQFVHEVLHADFAPPVHQSCLDLKDYVADSRSNCGGCEPSIIMSAMSAMDL